MQSQAKLVFRVGPVLAAIWSFAQTNLVFVSVNPEKNYEIRTNFTAEEVGAAELLP
jgi:hypothetical protein